MEAKELMIGNLILKNNEIYEISSLFFVDLHDGTIRKNNNYVIEPIKITHEWLVKLGFTIKNYPNGDIEYFYKDYRYNLIKKENYDGYYFCDVIVLRDLEFIHELQNIYFVLIGTELKLNND